VGEVSGGRVGSNYMGEKKKKQFFGEELDHQKDFEKSTAFLAPGEKPQLRQKGMGGNKKGLSSGKGGGKRRGGNLRPQRVYNHPY